MPSSFPRRLGTCRALGRLVQIGLAHAKTPSSTATGVANVVPTIKQTTAYARTQLGESVSGLVFSRWTYGRVIDLGLLEELLPRPFQVDKK